MLKSPSTQLPGTPPVQRVPTGIRRAALLGAMALSLALAGSPAAARVPGAAGTPGPTWFSDVGAQGLALATGMFGIIHRSVGSWSESTIEAVSLLLLGFGLIATSRWLGRERRQRDALVTSATVTAEEVATLKPQDTRVASFARRAAR